MPYVTKDSQGVIVAIHQEQGNDNRQWEADDNPEVINFIKNRDTSQKVKQALTGSDNEMVRVIEDLVDLLMKKQIFVYTELPEAVQVKLNARKQLRHDMSSLGNLINDDEDIF